jgi:exopolyphosphatase / guanosine-5'-triphosphate,3'-diphosphate pyrophosphatase
MNNASTKKRSRIEDGDLIAAVDLGSNSFHMVVARYVLGQLRIVDRIKETVRMAQGLDERGGLSPEAQTRALDCLKRFGQRLESMPRHTIRALATNSVRTLRDPQRFLLAAEQALGHPIEVVAGREEARLIYLGVAHGHPPGDARRLVMDIGGGSTEFIVGQGFNPLERESLQMGCIATTKRFFADGKISKKRWQSAKIEIAAEFQQFESVYRALGWNEVYGSSGTIKAIGEICDEMKLSSPGITAKALAKVVDALLQFDQIADIKLPGLSNERRAVIAGGILILDSAFDALNIEQMLVSENAMREGALYDLIGRGTPDDPHEASVQALQERYAIDLNQAQRVENTAVEFYKQVKEAWSLQSTDKRQLRWAAQLHELGLAIAHSQYHQHSAYVLENSDVAGFSKTEQVYLAALVRNHRRGINMKAFDKLPDRLSSPAQRCAVLLRLAVLLHRSHQSVELPDIKLKASEKTIEMKLAKSWLNSHPLTRADLSAEADYLAEAGWQLTIES